MEEEKTNEQPEQTENEQPEQTTDEEQKESLSDIVTRLKEQYESKIVQMEKKHTKDIEERDKIIAQLLDDNKESSTYQTVSDRINQKRNYKKW